MTVDYSQVAVDHFTNPRNVGQMAHPSGVGECVSESSGDRVRLYIAVAFDRIARAQFLASGCAASIASASLVTEMVLGRTLDEAATITADEVVAALGGLPVHKVMCSVLAADALREAILDYRSR